MSSLRGPALRPSRCRARECSIRVAHVGLRLILVVADDDGRIFQLEVTDKHTIENIEHCARRAGGARQETEKDGTSEK